MSIKAHLIYNIKKLIIIELVFELYHSRFGISIRKSCVLRIDMYWAMGGE